VDEKFATLAATVVSGKPCTAIRDTVRELEKVRDVSMLTPLLVTTRR
jgi:hypothetical protein